MAFAWFVGLIGGGLNIRTLGGGLNIRTNLVVEECFRTNLVVHENLCESPWTHSSLKRVFYTKILKQQVNLFTQLKKHGAKL